MTEFSHKKKTSTVEPAIKQGYEEISTKNQATRLLMDPLCSTSLTMTKYIT